MFGVVVFGAGYKKFIPAATKKHLSNQSVEKKGVECLFYKCERAGIRTESGSRVRLYTERLMHQTMDISVVFFVVVLILVFEIQ